MKLSLIQFPYLPPGSSAKVWFLVILLSTLVLRSISATATFILVRLSLLLQGCVIGSFLFDLYTIGFWPLRLFEMLIPLQDLLSFAAWIDISPFINVNAGSQFWIITAVHHACFQRLFKWIHTLPGGRVGRPGECRMHCFYFVKLFLFPWVILRKSRIN